MRPLLIAVAALLPATAMAKPNLQVTGYCPGLADITVSLATPGGRVVFVSGTEPGSFTIPGGKCAGTVIEMGGDVRVRKIYTASQSGTTHIFGLFESRDCKYLVQVLDEETCEVSYVQPLWPFHWPNNKYYVSGGPSYTVDPPTYTCLEACAQIFGGATTDYTCSVSPTNDYKNAHTSTWGEAGCPIWPEDYKVGTNYDCGSPGCATSAYVNDNCVLLNYCNPATP